jgi:hypothetical protein
VLDVLTPAAAIFNILYAVLLSVALAAAPPLTMVVLLACDRDAIWGNFPPSAPLRAVQRVASVAVFALPGLLAWAAS